MHYVYILQSIPFPEQTYKGYTLDLKKRFAKHNEGGCKHTAKYKPWKLVWYCASPDKGKALAFEAYLKSHSGIVFTRKRLIDQP